METRKFTKNDLLVSVYATLLDGAGNAVNLAGQTVAFTMESDADGTNKVDAKAAVIVNATTGEVRYDWSPEDIDAAGTYWAWFIRDLSGQKAHHPVGRQFKIIIEDKP